MATVGGPIEEVNIAGRGFSVAADADTTRKLGGTENEVQSNGNGTARKIATKVPWSIAGLTLSCDDDAGDHEFLQEVSDDNEFVSIAVTYASGAVLQGTGTISGELAYSSQNSTCACDLSGPGKLTKQ